MAKLRSSSRKWPGLHLGMYSSRMYIIILCSCRPKRCCINEPAIWSVCCTSRLGGYSSWVVFRSVRRRAYLEEGTYSTRSHLSRRRVQRPREPLPASIQRVLLALSHCWICMSEGPPSCTVRVTNEPCSRAPSPRRVAQEPSLSCRSQSVRGGIDTIAPTRNVPCWSLNDETRFWGW